MISAIVLAAGRSIRMGEPKMLLPWGESTVIASVISTLIEAEVPDIHIVTGGNSGRLRKALEGYRLSFIDNPDFLQGEMISSVKVGLRSLSEESQAALIVLGDQPQIEAQVVVSIMERYSQSGSKIIVPSYQMHRGHPWLVDRVGWDEILALPTNLTLINYLNQNQSIIDYVNVSTPSVLQDLDTPDDYQQHKP